MNDYTRNIIMILGSLIGIEIRTCMPHHDIGITSKCNE